MSTIDKKDPFHLDAYQEFGIGFDSAGNRSLVDPRKVAGQKTVTIVTLGQSNISNSVAGVYQSASPNIGNIHNFNFIDGGMYEAKDALLGCHGTGLNTAMYLAEKMRGTGVADRVILAPMGFSASSSGDWASGGILNHRIGVMARRMAVLGYGPDIIIWHQGEADAGVTPQSVMQANLQSMIDTCRSVGFSCPIIICKASYRSPANPSDAATRAAQAAVVNTAAKVYAGADTDTLGAEYRYDNGPHFNLAGSWVFADLLLPIVNGLL